MCEENLSDIIGLNQKYVAGRYEIQLFVDSNYEVRTDSMLDFLNRKHDESGLGDWTEFELCTGIVDYDIMMYCFYPENEKERECVQNFESLAIS